MKDQESTVSLEVFEPTGAFEVTHRHAPRLSDLRGKTICELSDGVWEDFRTFPFIREQLQNRVPDLKIIPYTEFPNVYGVREETLVKVLKEKGGHGVIVGNAA